MEVLDWKINPTTVFELAENIFKYKLNDILPEDFECIKDTFKNYALFAIDGNLAY